MKINQFYENEGVFTCPYCGEQVNGLFYWGEFMHFWCSIKMAIWKWADPNL